MDTTGTVHAYAGAAKKRGATVIEHNRVLELHQTADGWQVVTEKGTVSCEHVVNAAGLWAKQVGRMAGVELPVSPLKHHYLITETIPEVAALDVDVADDRRSRGLHLHAPGPEGHASGHLRDSTTSTGRWTARPGSTGWSCCRRDPDRIEDELTLGFQRYPCLETAGIKTWVNGAFTFSPDGNPLVGPVPGKRGYWAACAVMAGFLQGGGVGKSLAEWMIHGEPEADVYGMDVARYGDFAQNKRYIRETTGQFYSRRFVMTYPNEQLPAGRPLKMAPAHDAMSAAGCAWGCSWDLEVPLYFAPKGFVEIPSLRRSNAHDIVAAEVRGDPRAASG